MPLITSPVVGRELRLAACRDDIRQDGHPESYAGIGNFQFLREAVLSGLRAGLVPSFVVQEDVNEWQVSTALNARRLSIFGTRLFLLHMPGRDQTPAVRTFIDFVIEKAAQWSK